MARPKTKPGRLSDLARHVVLPSGITSTGWPAVRDVCAEFGDTFDEWQDGAGRAILAKRADGIYAATVGGVTLSIPRQVAKTFLVGRIIFALCVLFPGLKVIWTAHRTRTATNTFRALQGYARRRKVAPHIRHIRMANGEQEIAFRNGSVIMFGAREQGFGRGFDEVDIEVFDEAQILTEKALEDMVAATNQARHPHGALLFYMGTPPRPVDPGEAFWLKRTKALSGEADDMVFIEFSADQDADPDDRTQWAKANPSFPNRTPLESMLRLRENLPSDDAWRREALGIWDEVDVSAAVIPPALWSDLVAQSPPGLDVAPTAIGLDRWHDGTTSVAAGWRNGETIHVELVAVDVLSSSSGVVAWLAERAGRRIPVLIAADSPAASLAGDLRAQGVKVRLVTSGDYARACGAFVDDALESRLTHADQQQLDTAVAGARKKDIGRAGAWGWDRARPDIDISGLVAATLARAGAVQTKPKTGRVMTA